MRVDPSKIIPTSDDLPERWIAFHKALKSWFGKQSANAYFVKFWSQRAGEGSTADTHGLRKYMDEQGVDLTTNWKGAVNDSTLGVFEWLGDTANILRIVVVGAVVVAIGVGVYYVVKKVNRGETLKPIKQNTPLKRIPELNPQLTLPASAPIKYLP